MMAGGSEHLGVVFDLGSVGLSPGCRVAEADGRLGTVFSAAKRAYTLIAAAARCLAFRSTDLSDGQRFLAAGVIGDGDSISTSVKPDTCVRWSQLEKVLLVNVTAGNGYSECFWVLSGGGSEVVTPVDVALGAEELTEQLLSLPGFVRSAWEDARRAEALGQAAEFLCWQRNPSGAPGAGGGSAGPQNNR